MKKIKQIEAMRNPFAASLAHGANKPKVVAPKKGKGSYTRKPKHSKED